MTAVGFGDERTAGCVDDTFNDVMPGTQLEVAGIFVHKRSEERDAKDVLGDVAECGCTQPLAERRFVSAIVRTAVDKVAISGGG